MPLLAALLRTNLLVDNATTRRAVADGWVAASMIQVDARNALPDL
jgi:hypothetical protein